MARFYSDGDFAVDDCLGFEVLLCLGNQEDMQKSRSLVTSCFQF